MYYYILIFTFKLKQFNYYNDNVTPG